MITNELGQRIEIHSTGTCFDDATQMLERWIFGNENKEDWHNLVKVAHGICKHENGHEYAHAWLEKIGPEFVEVWQGGLIKGVRIDYCVERREFYKELSVRDVTLYSLREFALENVRTGHCGPFRADLDALTNTPRAARAIYNGGKKG